MQVYFPYETVREEQKELIQDITQVVSEGKTLLANAPTGLGKTVSSLAPTIAYAKSNNKKVFFLTPKISQHEIVLETVNEINKKFGLNIKAIDLVGRKGLCIDPFLSNIGYGFYDACAKKKQNGKCKFHLNARGKTIKQKQKARQNKAGILKEYNIGHLEMKEKCFVQEMCPYEITLEMCSGADVIVADYSHLFDEGIRESILGSAKTSLSNCILIVDEAHNLSERIRDMFTVSINEKQLENAEKEAKSVANFEVEFVIKDMKKEFLSLGKNLSLSKNELPLREEDLDFLRKLARDSIEDLKETAYKYMSKRKTENSFLSAIATFLEILKVKKDNPIYLLERKNNLGISIVPLDISYFTSKVLNKAHSGILMSGTLLPLEMHKDLLGLEEVVMKEYKSPFPSENRLNLFVNKTTTKYTERNGEMYKEIAEVINKSVPKIPGNSIIFFPSFEILSRVEPHLRISRQVLRQESEMSLNNRTNLIHNFKSLGQGFGGVLLAVSGGIIAEGLDFPGEHLYGTIVVGVPFARVSFLTNSLIKFYDYKFKKGWDYAYNAPAISKAVQASGRVIRTEKDKGVCLFLDKRFSDPRFKKFYPTEFGAKTTSEPEKEIEDFF